MIVIVINVFLISMKIKFNKVKICVLKNKFNNIWEEDLSIIVYWLIVWFKIKKLKDFDL